MHTITIGRIDISIRDHAAPRGPGLREQLVLWLRMRRTRADLDQLDPRILADIGVPPRAPDPARRPTPWTRNRSGASA